MLLRIKILALLAAIALPPMLRAAGEPGSETRSRRSSICSILVKHDEQKFADEIDRQFSLIPVSERFNDHNLSVRTVNVNGKKVKNKELNEFIDQNLIASRLVARWFDRNKFTGACTLDTVRSRGLYDASVFDRELAQQSVRGKALLEDAGEELIGNTYLLLNEVKYVDKAKRSRVWGTIGGIAAGVLMAAGGGSAAAINKTANNLNTIISSYKGFSVKITTRLYRLVWDKDISGEFFSQCYSDRPDKAKADAFDAMRPKFRLEYMGQVTSKGGRTSFMGINEEHPEEMIRKACARAIDENIADLQHDFEPFRIKSPILTVDPYITVPIGRKEGLQADSKFEVLEMQEKDGKVKYHRVAVVKPVANRIWDNRFMADSEGAVNANLGSTTFVKTSGGNIYPGMLIREID